MWFRNLRPYRLPERLGLDAEALAQRLSSHPFTPCRPAQVASSGWVPALGDAAEALVHAAGPYWLVRLQREEKLLPASVIREEVNNRVSQIQLAEGRKVYRKERMTITDEVTQDLTPRAFTRSRSIEALIDEANGWIWVDQAAPARAEDLLAMLRDAIGSLPVVLPDTRKSPAVVMTDWLLNASLPTGFELGGDADLLEPGEDGGAVRLRGVMLDSDEVRNHLDAGRQVQRLALNWQDRIDFVLGNDLVVRRLRFAEALIDTNNELKDDYLAHKDADFLLLGEAVAELNAALLEAFGGLEA